MKKIVFLFPGQGGQKVMMGKDLYDSFEKAKEIFDKAPDIRDLCFEGTEQDLIKTENTQPAIFLVSMAVDNVLKSFGFRPVAAGGHSLGEYSALCSAGVFDLLTGLNIVKERGKLMQKAGEKIPGAMAAVIGLSDDKVKEICEKAEGIVEPVNFNAPGQVVVSGEKDSVTKLLPVFKSNGAKMTVPLNVSGAFHSSLLKDTAEEFESVLSSVKFNEPLFPVVSNVDAEFHIKDKIKERLKKQLCNAVLWTSCIFKLKSLNPELFFETGPGNVLKGLMKKIEPSFLVETAGTAEECKLLSEKYTGGFK